MIEASGGVVTGLSAALDALGMAPPDADLQAFDAGTLLARTATLVRLRDQVDAELARTVRVAENLRAAEHDGLKSMASWLRGHTGMSQAAAGRTVRAGRTLALLPAVAAAADAGQVSAERVDVLAPVAGERNLVTAAGQGLDLAGVGATFAAAAVSLSYADLGKAVAHYLSRLDPDGPEPDPTQHRSFTIVKHPDGSVTGRLELDAAGGEKLQAAVESIVQADRSAADERSRAQQLGDALVQLCDLQLAAGNLPILRTVKPQALALIAVEDLVDPATGPGAAELGFGAAVSAARARWLACDSQVTRVVMGPDGQPLDYGRTVRLVPPHLRRAVEARDRACVFTGCQAPTHWCDVHHVLEWALGGETSLDNSALLCERHHTKVHHGFRVERQPDGRWRTWRPDGTEILVSTRPTPT